MQHALSHLGSPAGPGVGTSGAAATAAAAAAAAAAACWLPPADVVLSVGGRPFAAHRAVLSAHSGYLKALLVASDASASTISVPNVSPESFAPLLAFMYSGFLDLGPDNIYGVLLAAHLLHMPRALAFCRAFLLHQQQRRTALAAALASTGHHLPPPHPPPPPPPSTPPKPILKPIPSRKMLPVLVPPRWPPSHRPSPHSPPHLLHTPDASPFRAVISTSSSSGAVPQGLSPLPPPLPPPVPPPILHVPFHPERPYSPPPGLHADPGPSSTRTPSSLSPCPSSAPSSNSPSPVTSSPSLSMASNSRTPPPPTSQQNSHPMCNAATSGKAPSAKTGSKGGEGSVSVPASSSSSSTVSSTNSTAGPKVVLDVACCDGPVRFHRVLNDNYGLELGQLLGESAADGDGGSETLTVVGERPVLLAPAADKGPVERPSMGQDVGEAAGGVEGASRDDSSSVDVDSISSDASKSRTSTTNTTTEPLYRCLYCNHTFKSHYCYQKHTRRHINPVALELGTAGAPGCGVAGKLKAQVVVKEVKLLDMNVQYYPCKTCGSKFPSYYFVHKHRKMCHAGETGEGGMQNQTPSQQQQSQSAPQESSSQASQEGTAASQGGKSEGGEGEAQGGEKPYPPTSEASSSVADCQPKVPDFSPVFKAESGGGKW